MRSPVLILAAVLGCSCSPNPEAAQDDGSISPSPADASSDDTGRPDASRDDIPPRDASLEDAAPSDSGPGDAAIGDAAIADAALADAALADAALADASPADASPADASIVDAAIADAGPSDANSNLSGTLIENFSPPGGGLLWTCPDGTEISLSSQVSKQSTLCMGIDGSECHEPGVVPGPGDPLCDDPAFNGFKDTCVEVYFSCFQAAGTCTIEANGNQTWGNGALQDRNSGGFIATYIPPGEAQPCITATLGSGIVTYEK